MSSYRQHLFHIIIRTKYGKPTISLENSDKLYSYIAGAIKGLNGHPFQINGTENHIHILTDIPPSMAPASFVKNLKVSASIWMKGCGDFPSFIGWSEGYGSFTCAYKYRGRLIEYIRNQREHHLRRSFEQEYMKILLDEGIQIDERYFP